MSRMDIDSYYAVSYSMQYIYIEIHFLNRIPRLWNVLPIANSINIETIERQLKSFMFTHFLTQTIHMHSIFSAQHVQDVPYF